MKNPWITFSIVLFLGVVAVGGVGGLIVLPLYGKENPQALIATVSGCVGALAGFLSSRGQSEAK